MKIGKTGKLAISGFVEAMPGVAVGGEDRDFMA
jgi:hypothetical protein